MTSIYDWRSNDLKVKPMESRFEDNNIGHCQSSLFKPRQYDSICNTCHEGLNNICYQSCDRFKISLGLPDETELELKLNEELEKKE